MDTNSFNEKYLNDAISKLTEEKKICYLAGDFNIDLLKSDTDNLTKDFFDTLTTNLFVPHITLPTRITNRSQMTTFTLIIQNLRIAPQATSHFQYPTTWLSF